MILAILQARMSSTRLPGKVMKPLLGRPMMGRMLDRLKRSRRIDRIVVATSVEPGDDAIAAFLSAEGIACHRGPLHDVLGRYHGALEAFGPADHVVRVTADCPVIDWEVVDELIDKHVREGNDYTTNTVVRTYPDGLDVEVMKAEVLRRAFREAEDPPEREHVTMFIYRHPEVFRISHLERVPPLGGLRWTVDRPDDFEMVSAVYTELLPVKPDFLTEDITALLARRPDIAAMNAGS